MLSNKIPLNLCACHSINSIFKLLYTFLQCLSFEMFIFRKYQSNVYCYQWRSNVKHCLRISVKSFKHNNIILFQVFSRKSERFVVVIIIIIIIIITIIIIIKNSQWVGNFLDRKITRGRTVIQDQRVYE